MITPEQWASLIHLKKTDFRQPDLMQWSIVRALDVFVSIVKSRPVILDDYRAGDPKQHGRGLAIDTTWPGVNPLDINRRALGSNLFSGIGLYVNEAGAVSHHFDTRTDRTPANPAKWGGIIEHPFDENTQKPTKTINYTALETVVELVKKKLGNPANLVAMALIGFGLYLLLTRNRGA
jgi:hypothetical protein